MAVSNGVLAVAAIVIVVAIGTETYVRQRDVQDLRQAIAGIATKIDGIDAAVKQANTAAAQAGGRADEAAAAAARAKETADRAAAALAATPAPAGPMARPTTASDVAAGRDRALLICAVCHVVAPDQQITPVLQPPAPDFHGIVNRPSTTADSLHDFLMTPHGKMPDPMLMDQQVKELVAYMMTLRDHR
jgi:mono/diheme cytochrome c family protein